MKAKKRILSTVLTIIFMLGSTSAVIAHLGGTDENGGHYDNSTGEYHYHHGLPAHYHNEDGSCPYDEQVDDEYVEYDESVEDEYEGESYVGIPYGESYEPLHYGSSRRSVISRIKEWNYGVYATVIAGILAIILIVKRSKISDKPSTEVFTEQKKSKVDATERKENPKNKDEELLSLLKSAGIPFVDNRNKNGCLWIVGGEELIDVVAKAKCLGFTFHFKKEGGHATRKRPGWWTK